MGHKFGLCLQEEKHEIEGLPKDGYCRLTLNRRRVGGGGIRPQAGSSLCCAETVSSRRLKLSDFYYILIGFHF